MSHASLTAIGPTEGRADGIIDALHAAVVPSGTLLMVLGSRDEFAWVNERPEGERAELLARSPPFNATTTPADPDVGVLAEVLRGRPDVLVSDHPDGRFAAPGAEASMFVRDVPWDDYYGSGSPLERLVEADGRILRLGADTNTVTLIHYAENLVDLPDKEHVRRHHRVATPSGPQLRVVDTIDDEEVIVYYPDGDYFADILAGYLATGEAGVGQVGGAVAELIEARSLVAFAVDWMEK
jgi:aminoglycoside 3-N-acetyltransferase